MSIASFLGFATGVAVRFGMSPESPRRRFLSWLLVLLPLAVLVFAAAAFVLFAESSPVLDSRLAI
ncbi:MAG: hypothetical protein QGI93_11075 [Planctomycetota bacterium]|nr:hypothetical protein [Planctomycetota bacterium]